MWLNDRCRTLSLSVLISLGLSNGQAVAEDFTWLGTDGYFFSRSEWSPPGPPSVPDTAFFTSESVYSVRFLSELVTNTSWVVENGEVEMWSGASTQDSTYAITGNGYIDNNGKLTLGRPGSLLMLSIGDHFYVNTGTFNINAGSVGNRYGHLGSSSGSSGMATVNGESSLWTNSEDLYVGDAGDGRLSIQAGGKVDNLNGYLGFAAGSSGYAGVDGDGSEWSNARYLYVGKSGIGGLDVLIGGTVSAVDGFIGSDAGSRGVVNISGTNASWANSRNLYIGKSGTGDLHIGNGSKVYNIEGYLGHDAGSSGVATVDGSGANWTSLGDLHVGHSGTGALRISNGGTVDSVDGFVGSAAESIGTVILDGARSAWMQSANLYVGSSGTGSLFVQNGGKVAAVAGYIGFESSGRGDVSVIGADSIWNSQLLRVGSEGTGNLTVSNGGKVTADTGFVGWANGGSGEVNVGGGIGSALEISNSLWIGSQGDGHLLIHDGGNVSNEDAYIGGKVGNSSGATVNGTGSHWNNARNLFVGYASGALHIGNGASVSDTNGYVGYLLGSHGAASVEGAGSAWSNSNRLHIGHSGHGSLTIRDGGNVVSDLAYLGYAAESTGYAEVDGDGSAWGSNILFIGLGSHSSGTLAIRNGGTVNSAAAALGLAQASTGLGTVSGPRSAWRVANNLYIGNNGTGKVFVNDGGTISNEYGYVGLSTLESSTETGEIDVVGSDSMWVNRKDLHVGASDYGNGYMAILEGGEVSNEYGYVGDGNHSYGAVSVHGSGSTWTSNRGLFVGYEGSGYLSIFNGGSVDDEFASIGSADGGSSGKVSVDGVGSTWINDSSLHVGDRGTGTLNVSSGGAVNSGDGIIGYHEYSKGTATIDGMGSRWLNANDLIVGDSGVGALSICDGGSVHSQFATIGMQNEGELTIHGAASTLSIVYEFSVGGASDGYLSIEHGGAVTSADGYLGFHNTGNGRVVMQGVGTTWANSDYLMVGYSGTGLIEVRDGAVVTAPNAYLGYDTHATGEAIVHGTGSTWRNLETLHVGYSGSGNLQVLDDGLIVADRIAVRDTGTARLSGATIRTNALYNEGRINAIGEESDIFGSVENRARGIIAVSDEGSLTFHDDLEHNGAAFRVDAGSTAVFLGSVTGSGHFTGGGSLLFDGYLFPDAGIGVITAQGDLTLGRSATTVIEIGGLLRGVDYAAFDVGHYLTLDGTLNVGLMDLDGDPFTPQMGDSFDLFRAATISGNFDVMNLIALEAGLGWLIEVLPDATGYEVLRLSVGASGGGSPVPLPHAAWLMLSAVLGAAMRSRKSVH